MYHLRDRNNGGLLSRHMGMTYISIMSLWLMPLPVCPPRSRVF